MNLYRDAKAAERAQDRIARLLGEDSARDWTPFAASSPDPDFALANLERWLAAIPNPQLYADQIFHDNAFATSLSLIFGASQPLADILVQNPELSLILEDTQSLSVPPSVPALTEEGRILLKATHSFTHALDRLRYLRQRWTLKIALNDLKRPWPESKVWEAISDLAEGIVQLALDATWDDFTRRRSLEGPCPIMVVAFGKFGGRELNYSSDIDLVYVTKDDLSPEIETEIPRFCESLGRAISDRMGRGQLYRVDLRLRPYGAAGPIARSMSGYESYYRLYSEPWENQALIKSRPIAGCQALGERWEAMREQVCFKSAVSERTIEPLLSMRHRIEDGANPQDIKRSSGGIRDVEFIAQILQIVHGFSHPNLRTRPTVETLDSLEHESLLDHVSAEGLRRAYTFLRQLEHRIQLMGDQQTHIIPTDPHLRTVLARTMGEANWASLERQIQTHRRTIVSLYQSILRPDTPPAAPNRHAILHQFGDQKVVAAQWFDALDSSDEYYEALRQNQDSARRVARILEVAPALVQNFKSSVPLTEALLSGELEEPVSEGDRVPETNQSSIRHPPIEPDRDLRMD